jgi:uncharacterized membrane protein YedE/YeeE
MKTAAAGVGLGLGFGFLLSWAQVTDPQVIEAMLLLQSPEVFLLMGSAIAVSSLGAWTLRLRGARAVLTGEAIAWELTRPSLRHLAGSALFGLAWGVAKSCPGPIAAMAGQGQLTALALGVGVLAGALGFGLLERRFALPTAPARSSDTAACAP